MSTVPLTLPNLSAWRAWLTNNSTTHPATYITTIKNNLTTPTTLTYAEARDEALCHGWIDNHGRKIDTNTHVYRFGPRKSNGYWSKKNVEHVQRLESEGRILPTGRALIDAAKQDGRWDAAYGGSPTIDPDPVMLAAIAKVPEAQVTWEGLTNINRFIFCGRYNNLVTAVEKEKRVKVDIELLKRGELPFPQKRMLKADKREADDVTAVGDGVSEATIGTSTSRKARKQRGTIVGERIDEPVLRKTRSGRITKVQSYAVP